MQLQQNLLSLTVRRQPHQGAACQALPEPLLTWFSVQSARFQVSENNISAQSNLLEVRSTIKLFFLSDMSECRSPAQSVASVTEKDGNGSELPHSRWGIEVEKRLLRCLALCICQLGAAVTVVGTLLVLCYRCLVLVLLQGIVMNMERLSVAITHAAHSFSILVKSIQTVNPSVALAGIRNVNADALHKV